jgi:NAD(P)-dependent dehydrogenase (short-subunit alcohol dehydrogenase family)
MSATLELVGPVAVVTGVSSGIGRAVAIALARAGAHVAGAYIGDEAAAEEVRAEIAASGRESHIVRGDTGDPATHDELAQAVLERWGSLDIWVNNAARLMVKPLIEMTDEDWHGLLAANLHGYFYGCRAAARAMYPQGRGRIINVSSAVDILAVANLAAYTTAKNGIIGLTRTVALEAAPHGITVNAIAPGAIETPLNATAYTPQVRATYEQRIPLSRLGAPDDIADVVVFLASTASRYMTGHELVADGGLVIDGTVGHATDD